MMHDVGTSDGWQLQVTPEDILKNMLLVGMPGKGKTNTVLGMSNYLMHVRPEVGQLILDGAGTLAANIFLAHDAAVQDFVARGDMAGAEDEANRVVYVRLGAENSCGVTLDLFRRRQVIDDVGDVRWETAREKAEIPLATLAGNTRDAEVMELVKTYTPMAFTLILAAGFDIPDVDQLLTWNNVAFDLRLKAAIEARFEAEYGLALDLSQPTKLHPRHPGAAIHDEWLALQRLRAETAKSSRDFATVVGSTRRHFKWIVGNPLFAADGVDLAQFLDDGGVFLLDTSNADPLTGAKIRAGLYAFDVARKKRSLDQRPSIVVIDEQEGFMPDLIAPYLGTTRNREHYHWLLFQSPQQIGRNGEHFEAIRAAMQHEMYFGASNRAFAEELVYFDRSLRADAYYVPNTTRTEGRQHDRSRQKAHGKSRLDSEYERDDGSDGREFRVVTRDGGGDEGSIEHIEIYRPRYRPGGGQGVAYGTSDLDGYGSRDGRSIAVTHSNERVGVSEVVQLLVSQLLRMPTGTAIHIPSEGDAFIAEHRYVSEPLSTFPNARLHLRDALRRQKMLADASRVTPVFAAAPPPPPPEAPRVAAEAPRVPTAAAVRAPQVAAAPAGKPTRPPRAANRQKPSWAR
jgi:hypothetical protein